MKKRLLSVFLAAAMAVFLGACGGGSDEDVVTNNSDESTVDENAGQTASVRPEAPMGQLIIGSTNDLECDFYDPIYKSNATNYGVYSLLHGYGTIVMNKEGEWMADPMVVADLQSAENEDGTKTYKITLKDGLVWTDDTAVTAKDYVFAVLLESSPEMQGVEDYGAVNYTYVDGWEDFRNGTTKTLKGVHLIDDKSFSITVAAKELPNHYDLVYANVVPRPLAVIAPGCDITDSEDGASISGDFTTELLLETIADADTGYRYNPQVTCGPYKLVSYDAASHQGIFKVNDKFVGTAAGFKPVIETVIIKTVTNDTQINELKAGTVDLLFEINGGENIEAGLDLVDEGIVRKHTYFRYGYGDIQFDCSQFPTDSEKVRQAVTYCLDRNEFARLYSGGYATIVHGEYGLAQWEYAESKDWLDQNLNTYEKDIEAAKALLVEDGWTLNADGTEYQDGDGTRYKEVGGEIKPLVIEWCNSEGNPVAELLSTMLPEAMSEAGMELRITTTDYPTQLDALYHRSDKIYNMFNLGNNIPLVYVPWDYYSTDETYMGNLNNNWISDQELSDAAEVLKSIPFEDTEGWLSAWQNFQKIWNEKLPKIPLYSDEYHDFYNNKLQGWDTDSIWSWSSALIEAWVTE